MNHAFTIRPDGATPALFKWQCICGEGSGGAFVETRARELGEQHVAEAVRAEGLAPIVILDTETTGLNRATDEVWEFAAVRHDPDGTRTVWHSLVEHDLEKAANLPHRFRVDHDARYHPEAAIPVAELVFSLLDQVFSVPTGTSYHLRPHVIGAVPDFDLAILERTIGRRGNDVPWHHHIQCVENLAIGWLRGQQAAYTGLGHGTLNGPAFPGPPWDSGDLSRAVGVDPDQFARHTALGDVLWAEAILTATGGLPHGLPVGGQR